MSIRSCRGQLYTQPDRFGARQGGALVHRDCRVFARGVAPAADAQRQSSTIRSRRWPRPTRANTDILHEYFIPPERFADFLAACREIIRRATRAHINLTLRYVEADRVSTLAYAPVPAARIAAVMSFTQELTPEADRAMAAMTERLIEAALVLVALLSSLPPARAPRAGARRLSGARRVHRKEAY